MNSYNPRRSRKLLRFRSVLSLLILTHASVTVLAQAERHLCIPPVGGLAGTPIIDGVIGRWDGSATLRDLGWNGAAAVNLTDPVGTSVETVMHAGTDGGAIYLGLDVAGVLPDVNNTIVLTLGREPTPADPTPETEDWRIFIVPFDTITPIPDGTGLSPHSVTFWRNSSNWNSMTAVPTTAGPGQWPLDNVRYAKQGSQWSLEIRIPIASSTASAGPSVSQGVFLPTTGVFRFYANVLRTQSLVAIPPGMPPAHIQNPWPPREFALPDPSSNRLSRNTPAKSVWGEASLNPRSDCTGLSVAWAGIGVRQGSLIGSTISKFVPGPGDPPFPADYASSEALVLGYMWPTLQGPVNTFVARVNNTMASSAQLSASFKLANWGIPAPGGWNFIGQPDPTAMPPFLGVGTNPAMALSPIPAMVGTTPGMAEVETTWRLTYRWSSLYRRFSATDDRSHQCMQVELSSTTPGARFLNRTVQRNMDFVPASVFRRTATISGSHGEVAPGSSAHRFLLAVETDEHEPGAGEDPQGKRYRKLRSPELEALAGEHFDLAKDHVGVWIARGFLLRGWTLNINGTDYEFADHVGGFGYVAGHAGPFSRWDFKLEGEGLKEEGPGLYALEIPEDGAAHLETVLEAVESERLVINKVTVQGQTLTLNWEPHEAQVYSVWRTMNLNSPFQRIRENLQERTYSEDSIRTNATMFYRISTP